MFFVFSVNDLQGQRSPKKAAPEMSSAQPHCEIDSQCQGRITTTLPVGDLRKRTTTKTGPRCLFMWKRNTKKKPGEACRDTGQDHERRKGDKDFLNTRAGECS